jgi:hypothetical protein
VTQGKWIPKRIEKHGRSIYKTKLNPFSRKLTRLFEREELIQRKAFYYETGNTNCTC